MISVIICSGNKSLSAALEKNIQSTIGVPHEVIIYDNTVARQGICSVYNRAAARARYPILCFVHEDVCFKSFEWGKRLAEHLRDPEAGIIGIAGGDSFSRVPSTWSNSFISNSIYLIQHSPQEAQARLVHIPSEEHPTKKRVIALDGVFMCLRKPVFDLYPFDESLLKGFHGYDVDFSLAVSSHYKNYVVYNILIEHFSPGKPGREWLESTLLVSEKWRKYLPVSALDLNRGQYNLYHWQSLHLLIINMFKMKYNPFTIYGYGIKYSFSKHFTLRRFISMNRLFLRRLFGLDVSDADKIKDGSRQKEMAI